MKRRMDLKKYNLKKMCPEIAKEWNFKKNKKLKPEDVLVGSHRKVWWQCEKGHEWESCIVARTRQKQKCPICANRRILKGYNDLKTLEPKIAKLWNKEKNGDLKPTQVSVNSNKRVWWKCPKGHEYSVKIIDKVRKKSGCPICSNRVILPGYNDLKTLRPDIAAEWAEKRNQLTPEQVGVHSNKKVWWKCSLKRHYWEARVNDRTRKEKGTNCPYCAGKRKWKNVSKPSKSKKSKKYIEMIK